MWDAKQNKQTRARSQDLDLWSNQEAKSTREDSHSKGKAMRTQITDNFVVR